MGARLLPKSFGENVKIAVTLDDIHGHDSGENPITRAIRRATGQTWIVFGGTTAYLRSEPYRSVALPYEVFEQWQVHQNTGVWHPFEFDINIEPRWQTVRKQSTRRNQDRRARERRKQPRFGFDRRLHDRRQNDRRHGDRRAGSSLTQHSPTAGQALKN